MDNTVYRIYRADEWSALYINGQLDRAAESYLIDERLYEIFGVEIIDNDSFLLGQTQRDGVARTEDEIEAYDEAMTRAHQRIAELEEETAQLKKEFKIR